MLEPSPEVLLAFDLSLLQYHTLENPASIECSPEELTALQNRGLLDDEGMRTRQGDTVLNSIALLLFPPQTP